MPSRTASTTIATAGTSIVTVTTKDVVGNTETRTYTVKIDKTNPIVGTMTMRLGSSTGTNYTNNTWTKQSVYLSPVNGSDALSGHSITTYEVTGANTVETGTTAATIISNTGTSNVTVTTKDNAGNILMRSYIVKIDQAKPVAGTMIMRLGSSTGGDYTNDTWTNQSIYLAPINGSDTDSGHSTTTYVVSGANTVTSRATATTIANTGTSIVTVTTTDVVGNTSTSVYTVKIDKVQPVSGTMAMRLENSTGTNYTNDTWTNKSVYLELVNGSDVDSGHKTTTYSVSGANTVAVGTIAPTTITQEGTSTVTVLTTDNVGYTSTHSYIVKIDKTAPSVGNMSMKLVNASGAPYTSDTWTNQNIYVAPVNGSDALSGHGTTTYEISGANPLASRATAATITLEGTSNITVTTTDNAGNTKTSTITYTVKIDKTPPVAGTMTMKLETSTGTNYPDNTWTTKNIYLEVANGSDALSGHSSTTYQVSGANTIAAGTTAPQTIINTGASTATVTTKDVAGNSETNTYNPKIDKIAPSITFSTNGGTSLKASTSVTATDSNSGVKTCEYIWTTSSSSTAPINGWNGFANGGTLTYTPLGEVYLWVRATDNLDNVKTERSNVFNVVADSTPPALPTFTLSPASWTNGDVNVTINYSTDTATKLYSTDGLNWYGYSSAITVKAYGDVVYAIAYDAAGNSSNSSVQITNIDKELPTVEFGTNGGSNVPKASTTVTVSDTGGSKIKTNQYIWSTSTTEPTSSWITFTNGASLSKVGSATVTGAYYLWIKVTDNAGNITITRTNSFGLIKPATLSYWPYVSSWGYGTAYSNSGIKKVNQGEVAGYVSTNYTAIVEGNLSYVDANYATKWGPLRLEGIKIYINDGTNLTVKFNCHVSNLNWQGLRTATSTGTEGGSVIGINSGKPYPQMPVWGIEAFKMELSGTNAGFYNLEYCAYGPYNTTENWVQAPGEAGTTGKGQALYGIKMRLTLK